MESLSVCYKILGWKALAPAHQYELATGLDYASNLPPSILKTKMEVVVAI